uniref:Uncharacterized protein n=1 Tax=Gossypium raimondii TaxID=29730 RepID=A0A0D2VEC7_GOSRA|nr:hypothetical protein B456_013G158000 [Gossypium raimondii]
MFDFAVNDCAWYGNFQVSCWYTVLHCFLLFIHTYFHSSCYFYLCCIYRIFILFSVSVEVLISIPGNNHISENSSWLCSLTSCKSNET